jgi:hypothetical protein
MLDQKIDKYDCVLFSGYSLEILRLEPIKLAAFILNGEMEIHLNGKTAKLQTLVRMRFEAVPSNGNQITVMSSENGLDNTSALSEITKVSRRLDPDGSGQALLKLRRRREEEDLRTKRAARQLDRAAILFPFQGGSPGSGRKR